MKLRKNTDSAYAAYNLRNAIWALPYLAAMGLMWGYLAAGSSAAAVGPWPASLDVYGIVGGNLDSYMVEPD